MKIPEPVSIFELKKMLRECHVVCAFCGARLNPENVAMYRHRGGFEVKGSRGKWWIYIECPNCHYQWSLPKLWRLMSRVVIG